MQPPTRRERRAQERTCVGCGACDEASAMVRLVLLPSGEGVPDGGDEVAFDLAGGAFGRGAHVHPRPDCLAKAPRGLSRSFRRESGVTAAAVARALGAACDRRMGGLLLAARRTGAVAVGADAALDALAKGAPLAVVAVDAGTVVGRADVGRLVAEGRAVAWKTKAELGELLGGGSVAICAVRHERLAGEMKRVRAAADAAVATMTREGAACSRRPEAR